jgi:hypothetical protein
LSVTSKYSKTGFPPAFRHASESGNSVRPATSDRHAVPYRLRIRSGGSVFPQEAARGPAMSRLRSGDEPTSYQSRPGAGLGPLDGSSIRLDSSLRTRAGDDADGWRLRGELGDRSVVVEQPSTTETRERHGMGVSLPFVGPLPGHDESLPVAGLTLKPLAVPRPGQQVQQATPRDKIPEQNMIWPLS